MSPYEYILQLESVKFWCTQIDETGHKNTTPQHSTMRLYLGMLARFNEWLSGRQFPSGGEDLYGREDLYGIPQDGKKSFEHVEEMLNYCEKSERHGQKLSSRIMREYLVSPPVTKTSANTQLIIRSAIKSYFAVHDVALKLPKRKNRRGDDAPDDDDPMTLEDFYKMLQNGRPSITMRAIMLIKLQSGMDSATLADRFNYEGYSQIVKYCKTDDHMSWDLARCPIPIKLGRVKTGVQYTTFLDHDAMAQLQEYLTWKETKYGKQDASKPLFITNRNTPIHSMWISRSFSEVAVRAGIQKKVSHRIFKMKAHAVRYLLKSTLITSGCAQYAADHVLGHAPRDPYEKQAILYPEMLRTEYAKASSRLNIISKVESNLNSPEDPESMKAQIQELKAEVAALKQSKTGEDFTDAKRKNFINGMNEKMNRLLRLFDALPDDIKERMSDEIDGTA